MVSVLTGLNQLSVQGKYKRLGQTDYTGALYRFIGFNESTVIAAQLFPWVFIASFSEL